MSRTSRRDMHALLEIAGRVEVPRRADRLAQLESSFSPAETPTPERPATSEIDELEERRQRRRTVPVLITGAAAAVVLLLLVAVLAGALGERGGGVSDDSNQVAFTSAVDTVAVLPDGTTVSGARGLVLPDGTIIRTGPAGRATVAGVRLGPDTEAVVRDGRVRLLDQGQPDVPTAGDGTGTQTRTSTPPGGAGGGNGTDGGSGSTGGGSTGGGSGGSSGGGGSGGAPTLPPLPPPTAPLPPVVVPPLPLPSIPLIEDVLPIG